MFSSSFSLLPIPDPNDTSVFLVFEYLDHDLAGLLASNASSAITIPHAKCWMKQLLAALSFMHNNKVIHRDLKAANVLINNNGVLKLADFGLARPMVSDPSKARYTNKVITLWYRPPELLFGSTGYGPSVDIWSAGCILAELMEKRVLFGGDMKERPDIMQLDVIWEIVGTPTPLTWPTVTQLKNYKEPKKALPGCLRERFAPYGPYAVDLLVKLLSLDPSRRPTASDALDHEFFWTDPRPLEPEAMPSFPSSHEWVTQQKKRARQSSQASEPAKRHKGDHIPSGSQRYQSNDRQGHGQYGSHDKQQQNKGYGGHGGHGGHNRDYSRDSHHQPNQFSSHTQNKSGPPPRNIAPGSGGQGGRIHQPHHTGQYPNQRRDANDRNQLPNGNGARNPPSGPPPPRNPNGSGGRKPEGQ
eukprot:TRINITY_DN2151_c0_g1_i1.p1 TRINITY_DN2151_c0_g1~~TRINITY_DN2151_c0_g1_i1.p1  ORF type:complete len:414 (-),score=48.84 TRINITY_DN2151_c0_g1_i1:10-1251(-)